MVREEGPAAGENADMVDVDGVTAGTTPASSASVGPLASSSRLGGNTYRPQSRFSFPRAAQPEVVRAYQKDVYYRDLLKSQLQNVARNVLGSRVLFTYADTISFVGSLAYFTLSTLGGAQTLGEEYVNAMMAESKSGRIVGLKRRLAFIFFHVISPFLLSKLYSIMRRNVAASHQRRSHALQRAKLRAAALAPRRGSTSEKGKSSEPQPSRLDRIIWFLADKLPTMDDINASDGWLAYGSAAHLALFYLGSRYYGFGQRMAGVKYISAITRRPGSKPPSYEVLGFLLGVQLLIRMILGANRWRRERKKAQKEKMQAEGSMGESEKVKDENETIQLDDVKWTHRTNPPSKLQPNMEDREIPLAYPDPDGLPSREELGLDKSASREQLEASRSAARVRAAELEAISDGVLKCTLCMEKREPEKGTSAITECGHVFCWECIQDWVKEKPECPLCRQSLNASHILPIYNF